MLLNLLPPAVYLIITSSDPVILFNEMYVDVFHKFLLIHMYEHKTGKPK